MPRADSGPVVLWRLGDALLAVDLAAVDEIVAIDADGPGAARVAVAADEVEGVVEPGDASAIDPPEWLRALETTHFRSLVKLADNRVAALLDVATLVQAR